MDTVIIPTSADPTVTIPASRLAALEALEALVFRAAKHLAEHKSVAGLGEPLVQSAAHGESIDPTTFAAVENVSAALAALAAAAVAADKTKRLAALRAKPPAEHNAQVRAAYQANRDAINARRRAAYAAKRAAAAEAPRVVLGPKTKTHYPK